MRTDEVGATNELRTVLKEKLIKEEGYEKMPYEDHLGLVTIGVGRCLDRVGISDAEISFLLDNDIESVFLQLTNAKPEWQYYPFNVRVVLCDMAFNVGVKGLSKFRNMWRCLAEADYIGAAEELMDSKYAEQVPNRAKRNAKLLKETLD
tara:strand:+ start:11787 stop:12233 length:447 start_codon:yes stop_codon:yes gene_type:complete